jgi:hypothetical protein
MCVYHNFICHLVEVILKKLLCFSLCDRLKTWSSTLPTPAKTRCVPVLVFKKLDL